MSPGLPDETVEPEVSLTALGDSFVSSGTEADKTKANPHSRNIVSSTSMYPVVSS